MNSDLNHSDELALNSLMIEYNNIFDRSNKLDNKVYIALTFCGFLFVFITGLFSGISRLSAPKNPVTFVVTGLYILSCVFVMISYAGVLVMFIRLLSPEELVRFEPEYIKSHHLDTLPRAEVSKILIETYTSIIRTDLDKLAARCHEYIRCLRYIVPTVVLAFLSYVLQIVLQVL